MSFNTRLGLLIGACLVLTSFGADGQPAPGGTYRDPQRHFSLQVPAGWTATPLGENGVNVSRGNAYCNVVMMEGGASGADILDQLSREIRGQWRDFTEIMRGDSAVSGQTAAFALFSGVNPKGVSSFLKITGLATGRRVYALISSAPQNEFGAVKGALEAIERSFSVGESPAAAGPPGLRPGTSPGAGGGAGIAPPTPARAVLGTALRDITAGDTQALGLREARGALVEGLMPNSPAEKAGLQRNDVVVAANRRPIGQASELVQIIAGHRPGDVVELVVLRAGRSQTYRIALAAPPGGPERRPPVTEPIAPPTSAPPFPAPPTTGPAGVSSSGKVVRLRPFVLRDPQVGNIEALRFLVPTDWRVDGQVVWRHDRSILATAVVRVFNPNGSEELNFLPIEPFAQSNPGFGFGIGSNYLGNELQPAMDPRTFVTRIVLPRYRRQIVGAALVDGAEVPGVAEPGPGIQSTNRAGRFRLSYNLGGRPMEEDVYCVLNYAAVPSIQTIYWAPVQLYSMRAEKGQLDRQTKLMQAMASSVKISLQWYNVYLQVFEMWKANVMQSIQNAGHLSRYIAGINNEITAMNRQAWQQQQASQDRNNRRFSEHIRGVETYHNPVSNEPVQLPAGYGRAWTSRSGEYIVSDSPNFNPNIGSSVEWQPMPRVP